MNSNMNGKDFFELLGDLDEDIVEDAWTEESGIVTIVEKRSPLSFLKIAAAAACIALMAAGVYGFLKARTDITDPNDPDSSYGESAFVRGTFSEIRESFEKDVENIKNKEYDNLNFDKAEFSPPPQIDSISELKLVKLAGKSPDELYDFFCKAVDTLTDNKYTDEEKRYEIRFADGKHDESKPYPYTWPDIDEYKNGWKTADPWLVIDDTNYFIWLGGGVIHKFNNGDLADYDGVERVDGLLEGYTILTHQHVFYTEDLTCTDTYRLVDGEISIADAVKFAQNYIDEFDYTPYDDANLPKPVIYAVNVFDIGGGYYGYDFMTTYEYNGVWFDRYEAKKGERGWHGSMTDYDNRSYGSWMGFADMIKTDEIHTFGGIWFGYDVVEAEPTTEIITVGSAADAVSEFFSGYMNFTVTEVSLTWLHTDNAQEAYPCWKFKMYANGEIYHTFVDVITGEIHLYVQAV